MERIENHIKKLDYLYKDKENANIYSSYLLEKVNQEKKIEKEKINIDLHPNLNNSNENINN
mgnify:CR=1 FL=1